MNDSAESELLQDPLVILDSDRSTAVARGTTLSQTFKNEIRSLSPAYFGMVMATGIVSIAGHLMGMRVVAIPLFWLNIVGYVVIGVLTLMRLVFYWREFCTDLIDHQRGPGFFTSVAASCILGSQFLLIIGSLRVAVVLWFVGIALWLVLTVTVFTAFTIKKYKPLLGDGISGAWLLAVVATQSICVLGSLIAAQWAQPFRLETNFFALSMWLWGGMLYIWMISMIFYRYTFFNFSPGDLSPPYWINMGAMAISTFGGSLLIINAPDAPFLSSLLPFLKGFTVFYWATGTWWIPMLVILAVWRYGYKRFPLRYDPLYWGAVFPLGMYTVGTLRMAQALQLDFLNFIPRYSIYIALLAWLATFAGLLSRLIRLLLSASKRPQSAD